MLVWKQRLISRDQYGDDNDFSAAVNDAIYEDWSVVDFKDNSVWLRKKIELDEPATPSYDVEVNLESEPPTPYENVRLMYNSLLNEIREPINAWKDGECSGLEAIGNVNKIMEYKSHIYP